MEKVCWKFYCLSACRTIYLELLQLIGTKCSPMQSALDYLICPKRYLACFQLSVVALESVISTSYDFSINFATCLLRCSDVSVQWKKFIYAVIRLCKEEDFIVGMQECSISINSSF